MRKVSIFIAQLILSGLFLVFIFCVGEVRYADAASYQISGSVTDYLGVGVESTVIEVIDSATSIVIATTVSDYAGHYSLGVNEGVYNIKAIPIVSSGYVTSVAHNRDISADATINFILVPAGSASLSGYMYDSLGNPVSGQSVRLMANNGSGTSTIATTDSLGFYLLQVSSASNYRLQIQGMISSLHTSYQLFTFDFSMVESKVFDLQLPTYNVLVKARNVLDEPISNVHISAISPQGIINGELFINGSTFNVWNVTSSGITDIYGEVALWLFPTDPYHRYSITATPPSGSGYVVKNLTNIEVTGDSTVTIVLEQPITLSGHIYDEEGNPVPNQKILLQAQNNQVTSTITDTQGNYLLTVSPDTYQNLIIQSPNSGNGTLYQVPDRYIILVSPYIITQSTVFDVIIPAKRVDVHVEDSSGSPIGNVQINVSDPFGYAYPLFLGSGINNAVGKSHYTSGPITNASGDAVLWLLPNTNNVGVNSYTINAYPQSPYTPTTITGASVIDDTQFTFTLHQPVTLSGTVYDSLGNPLSGQIIKLITNGGSPIITTSTDSLGQFSLQCASGSNYRLQIQGSIPSLNIMNYQIFTDFDFDLHQDTAFDVILPVRQFVAHIQNTYGYPLGGMTVSITSPQAIINGNMFLNDRIFNVWNVTGQGVTNIYGDTTIWLFDTDSNHRYAMNIIPPSQSIYLPFSLSNIVVTGDQTEIISLQFIHPQPVTTVSISPAPDGYGNYPDPTTVTLSATAASGYTVANTYYTLDGSSQQTYTTPFEVSGDGEHTVTYWSVDNVGVPESPNSTTFTILANQPPVITPIADATVNEGDTYTFIGSFVDATSSNWTATVDYGEGDDVEPLMLSGMAFTLSHTYKDNALYTVTIEVTDNQGLVATETVTITVNNVNPVVGTIVASLEPMPLSSLFTASVMFTDPGVLDTHTSTWDWGDGYTSAGTVTETNGSGSVDGSHTYTTSGVYDVLVTVTDKDSGVGQALFQYAVIYDNTSSSGFVTGSGAIDSPAGAYVADPYLTGIARFGFQSKYQNGASVPDGNTRFRFQAAGLRFESTVYDWLVVAGAQAKYKGTGTINGSGNYGFLLSGYDGQWNGGTNIDKFRIKIWDKDNGDTVIYDNQLGDPDTTDPTTEIIPDSGDIVVHKT